MARPTEFPRWADAGGLIVEPTELYKDVGWLAGQKPPAQFSNWLENLQYQWIKYLDDRASAFGNGADGAVALDGTNTYSFLTKSSSQYTCNRDVYLTDATLTGTATLVAGGFRIFVNGTLTIGASCSVHAATAGSAAVLGIGGAFGSGGTFGGASPGAGGSVSVALGGNGGAGAASTQSGAAGGVATPPTAAMGGYRHLEGMLGYLIGGGNLNLVNGGAGGGGGGGSNVPQTGRFGGAGGGVLVLFAKSIVNDGTIHANGGDAQAASSTGGKGGGGGGGAVFLGYRDLSGAGTVTATGGVFGGGAGTGANGADGNVIELVV